MSPFPYPRSFCDCEVPSLTAQTHQDAFNLYLNWLADYLFEKDIPIPDCQKNVTADILSLAEEISITTIVEDIEHLLESGEGFAELHSYELEAWDDIDEELRQDYFDESGNNDFFTTEEQFNRVKAEYEERVKVFPDGNYYLDIPYRPLLAKHLKNILDHAARIKALEGYFATIAENFGK